jgi:hypothetical protein
MPKPEETAKLNVRGASFEDWETVWVQHRWSEGWPSFRFTAAENNGIFTSMAASAGTVPPMLRRMA